MSSRHIVSGATTIDYDHDSSILTFTMHNIETCISRLVAEWKRIGKLATLAKGKSGLKISIV